MDENIFALLASITHEISNPLAGMYNTVQFLEQQLGDPNGVSLDIVRNDVKTLKGEINRLREVLQTVRDFRRARRLYLQPFLLGELGMEIMRLQHRHHRQRRIRTELDLPSSLPLVLADREQLKQVLLCLCKTAVERIASGGKLVLRGYQSENEIMIEVTASGRGVAGQGNLSGLFTQINCNGLALGLIIAHQIMVAHGGVIEHMVAPNDHAVFRVGLPLKPPVAEKAA